MEENNKSNSNKGLMMIVLIVLIILLAAVGVGGFLLWTAIQEGVGAGDGSQAGPPPQLGPAVITQEDIRIFRAGTAFVTNLLQEFNEPRRMIRVDLGIGIDNRDEEAATEFFDLLYEREIVIESIVIDILRRTTYSDVSHIDGGGNLRDDILLALQNTFATQLIVDVYAPFSTH